MFSAIDDAIARDETVASAGVMNCVIFSEFERSFVAENTKSLAIRVLGLLEEVLALCKDTQTEQRHP